MTSIHDVRMMGQRGADKREMLLGNSMFGRLLARRWRAACVLAPTLPWKMMIMVVVMIMAMMMPGPLNSTNCLPSKFSTKLPS